MYTMLKRFFPQVVELLRMDRKPSRRLPRDWISRICRARIALLAERGGKSWWSVWVIGHHRAEDRGDDDHHGNRRNLSALPTPDGGLGSSRRRLVIACAKRMRLTN